ncbi:MAG: T9SS type A sorting domain-containing protein [Chitinophagales bacterium]
MKKTITLFAFLLAFYGGYVHAGGASAGTRYDMAFGQNGFYIDTLTGGAYIQYMEILPGVTDQFWVGGVTNGAYLANKFDNNGSQLMSKNGLAYQAAGGYTGAVAGNKFFLGGQNPNGGHYQNMAYNFDGTTNPMFHQTTQPDSFITEALYGPNYPVGQSNPNCSDQLVGGDIVTAVINYTGDSLYITQFAQAPGTTVITFPKIAGGIGTWRPKALRTIPGSNTCALLVYNVMGSSTVFIINNGVATATYNLGNVHYEAMIAISNTQVLLGGDNLMLLNINNGTTTAVPAAVSGVIQLTRHAATGEIYAFTGSNIFALNASYTLDNAFNPDGIGNSFNYAPMNAAYLLGTQQVYYTDMEMLGNDILISGFCPDLNNHPTTVGLAGFVIKVLGKGSNPSLCANFSAQLDSVYGTGGCDWNAHISLSGAFPMTATFSWTGGGSTAQVTSSPFIPGGLCPETYEILFEDTNHCTALVNFVTPPPVPCNAPVISSQLSANVPLCQGETLQLGPLTVTGTTNYTQQWYKDGQPINGAVSGNIYIPLVTATESGNYYYVATSGCGAGSDTSNTAAVSVTTNTAAVIVEAGTVLTATQFTPGASFIWYLNGTFIPNANDSTYVVTQTGDYMVATTNGSCQKYSNSVNVIVNGIEDAQDNALSVYPNPATELLIISCDEEIETAEVYSITGQQVLFVRGQITKINVAPLAGGLYTLKTKSVSGKNAVKKFSKQ